MPEMGRPAPVETRTYIQVQARGRVTLGRLATADQYLARRESDGTIVLEPAEVMTAAEARLLAAEDVMAIVEANLADPDRLVTRDRHRSPRG